MLSAQEVLSLGNMGIVLFHNAFATAVVLKRRMGNVMEDMNKNFVAYYLGSSRNLHWSIQQSKTRLLWLSVFRLILHFAKLIINCEVKSDNVIFTCMN